MPRDSKKKNKKKDNIPSIATLSISDPQPSTSQELLSDDKGLGLMRGSRKEKKNAREDRPVSIELSEDVGEKTDYQAEAKPGCAAAALQDVMLTATDETQKRKEIQDDKEEVLGLGLSTGKKNRRKKKKSDNSTSSTTGQAPSTSMQETEMERQKISNTSRPRYVPFTTNQEQSPPVTAWVQRPVQAAVTPFPTEPKVYGTTELSKAVQLPPQVSISGTELVVGPGRGAGKGASPVSFDVRGEKTKPEPICLFKIPDKILGRSVPCRVIKVIANYLEMTIQPLKIYRYDVVFKPEKPKKFIYEAYSQAVKKLFGNVILAFDQRKNVYSIKALPGVPLVDRLKCEVTLTDSNDIQLRFEVSFKYTGIVDLNTLIKYMNNGGTSLSPPSEAIQAVDVVLRQGTLESYVKSGRQFFRRPSNPIELGEGLEMWTGLFQSAIFTSRPYINIDVAHKGFPKYQMLIDAYTRDFHLDITKTISEQRGRNVDAFLQFLKGLKVVAYIGGDISSGPQREFVINELVESPRRMFFKINVGTPEETRFNVLDYFEKEKKCRVRYPNLNCAWVGPKDKRIYYPLEFLRIAYGQVFNKQMSDTQLATLVKEAATPPLDRKRKIEEVITDMKYSKSDFFKKFGLDVSTQFVNVEAKIINPPKIDVGGRSIEPKRGSWQSKRLLKPKPLDCWGLISVETDIRSSFESLINMIIGIGTEMGMQVKPPKMVSFHIKVIDLMKTMQNFKDRGITIIFVVISPRGRDFYHRVKRIAELDIGILTQCIREFTAVRKVNEQTIRNVLFKVNSKLMGVNHALDPHSVPKCLQGKVMVIGADVTHPSPEQSCAPSIAAVTGSIDTKYTIYNITLSIQTPKKEMIVDFENMMVEHLAEYQNRQGELPSKIYVFRDGVSEGQFAQVMNSELQAVHNAYKRKVGPASTKKPEVLFLLVQKRHHTRVAKELATSGRCPHELNFEVDCKSNILFMGDSNQNVEPGTVVDSHIVHPKEVDFFLVSHQAVKGTARPTRYHAVCNDGRIPQDEVEQLTYFLCHLYARCTRSVSYPTPTYYAHLACIRARSLTYGDRFCIADLEKSPQRLRVLERMLENSKMFFV